LYFNVVASDGSIWSIDLQMTAWQPGLLTFTPAATGTSVSTASAVSVYGQQVTLTARVSSTAPGSGIPTGQVTFLDGTKNLGTATLSGGVAVCQTSKLSPGNHHITAVYNGGSPYGSSTSAVLSQRVVGAKTHVAFRASPNPAPLGQVIFFKVQVGVLAPGAGTPTGTVTFKDGSTVLGTTALHNGAAVFRTATLMNGRHTITAVYAGDSNFTGSASTLIEKIT
jgi:hypothetical protein